MRNLDADLDLGDELAWAPASLTPPDAWVGHVPFAFWLVKALRPDTLVELGTHSGNSYFAFCQALAVFHPTARAYAVDSWQGDAHAGSYGEEVFAGVAAFNAAHFRRFSTLLRTSFDAARAYFPEGGPAGGIDLLHIDGLHSYEAVRHDFETWAPTLSSRAIVLFHDIEVRERGFGVWRLWEELRDRFPSFAFGHSHGLGVLGIGPDQAPGLRALFALAGDPDAAARLRQRLAARGEAFQLQLETQAVRAQGEREAQALRVRWQDEAQALRTGFQDEAQALRAQLHEAEARLQDALGQHAAAEAALAESRAAAAARDATEAAHRAAIASGLAREAALREAIADHVARSDAQEEAARAREAEIGALHAERHRLARLQETRMGQLAAAHEIALMAAAARLREAREANAAAVRGQAAIAQTYVRSTSWRLTRPLRVAVRLARGERLRGGGAPVTPVPSAAAIPEAPAPDVMAPTPAKIALRRALAARLDAFLSGAAGLQLPRAAHPAVSIVLVLYNQAELTLACLTSIIETVGLETGGAENSGIEVVIVDNASTDATGALLDRVAGAMVIRNAANLHFLRAMNQAADAVRGEAILLLNNDAQLQPGALAAALRTLRSAADIGAVGGPIILPDGTLQEAGSIIWQDGTCVGYGRGEDPDALPYRFRRDVDFCSGAFLLTWTALWRMLGGFDAAFAPAYYEEVDYCVRLQRAGYRVVFDPDAAIVHYEFGSSAASGDALALQAAHHHIFAQRHADWLAGQFRAGSSQLLASTARTASPRVLVIDSAAEGSSLARDLAGLGAQTCLLLVSASRDGADRRRTLDSRVELAVAADLPATLAFLAARRGSFDAILIADAPALTPFGPALAAYPDLGGAVVRCLGPAPDAANLLGGLPPPLHDRPAPARTELPTSRPAESDVALAVPFTFPPADAATPRIAVVCHLHYPDIAAELRHYLRQLPVPADLFLSTDSVDKRDAIAAALGAWEGGRLEIRVLPNRGRDIAPKLVGFADIHGGYDLVLHLHSKRSEHTAFLAPWRSFLYENLLGSPAIVTSILDAFARAPTLGMVAPLHYQAIRRWIGWNGNFGQAQALAARMGIALSPARALDFPSGSMFWARPAALRPLFDLDLSFDDFPAEEGQKDHTPAHAIERLFFHCCEQSGHRWLKIADPALYTGAAAIVAVASPAAFDRFLAEHDIVLTGAAPIAIRPDPAPMMTDIPAGLRERLAARSLA